MARSIAKRAAGTIHSQMSEIVGSRKSKRLKLSVNAVGSVLNSKANAPSNCTVSAQQSQLRMTASLMQSQVAKAASGHGSQLVKAQPTGGVVLNKLRIAPLVLLEKDLTRPIRKMKDAGQFEKVEAYIEVLKMISKLKARL
jgi:hypothetical protein